MFSLRNILLIATIVIGGSYLYQTYGSDAVLGSLNKPTRQFADNVLGVATKKVVDTTSNASGGVQSVIYKRTATPLVDQFRKLPSGQQDEIRNQICPPNEDVKSSASPSATPKPDVDHSE